MTCYKQSATFKVQYELYIAYHGNIVYNILISLGGIIKMNTTSCISKIPENLREQIDDIISESGLSAKDFIKELAYCYNVGDAKSDSIVLDYSNYWNSFVD